MAIDTASYKPLSRRVRPFALAISGAFQLYLAPDHLLYVGDYGFSETYKRFYFRDIQALVLMESPRRRNINLVLIAFGLAGALFSLSVGGATTTEAGFFFFGVFALLFLIGIIMNAALGPTCICSIKTAVQTERIVSLNRLRSATNACQEITDRIVAAQGELMAEQTADRPPVVTVTPAATPVAPGPAVTTVVVRHEPGYWHAALFALLVLGGTVTTIDGMVSSLIPTLIGTCLLLGQMVLLIGAMIHQRESDISRPLRHTVIWVLGYAILLFCLCYVQSIIFGVQSGNQAGQFDWIRMFAASSPWDSPLLSTIYLVSIVGGLTLGSLGFVFWWQHLRTHQARQRDEAWPP